MKMQKTVPVLIGFVMLISSCTEPYNEDTINFAPTENFGFKIDHLKIEFIKDGQNFIKIAGNYDAFNKYFEIEENTQVSWHNPLYAGNIDNFPALQVTQTPHHDPAQVNKVEVHYTSLRKLFFMGSANPYNLAGTNHHWIYGTTPIQEDTLDIYLFGRNESAFELNTNRLNLLVIGKSDWTFKGHSNSVYMHTSGGIIGDFLYHGWELQTDTIKIKMATPAEGSFDVEVQADNLLEIDLQMSPQTNPCYIRYKGYPTILNHDSADSRVILVDSN